MRYSSAPSAAAVLTRPELAADSAHAILTPDTSRLRALPHDGRPKLVVHGVSLGRKPRWRRCVTPPVARARRRRTLAGPSRSAAMATGISGTVCSSSALRGNSGRIRTVGPLHGRRGQSRRPGRRARSGPPPPAPVQARRPLSRTSGVRLRGPGSGTATGRFSATPGQCLARPLTGGCLSSRASSAAGSALLADGARVHPGAHRSTGRHHAYAGHASPAGRCRRVLDRLLELLDGGEI